MARNRSSPDVTVGFVAKEKYSSAARCLRRLYQNADQPFRLIIIDGNIPPRYRAEMEAVLAGRDQYEFVPFERFLQPNEQKQIVIDMVRDGHLLLLENDNLVSPGFLALMLEACLAYRDECVVIPELFEKRGFRRRVHHDCHLGPIELINEKGRSRRKIHPDFSLRHRHLRPKVRRMVNATETHAYIFHRRIMDRIGGLDTTISTREGYDLSFQLHDTGVPIILEPGAEVDFISPPPIEREELPFFRFCWDKEQARQTNAHLAEKWNVIDFPDSSAFVASRNHQTHWFRWLVYRIRTLPWRTPSRIASKLGSRLLPPRARRLLS